MSLSLLTSPRGLPVIALTGAAALAALTYAGIASMPSPAAPLRPSPLVSPLPAEPEPLKDQELAIALSRLGLEAHALAAAGLSDSQTTALVGRVRAHLSEHIQDLRDADQNWASKRAEVDRLERKIRSGKSAPGDLALLSTARTELAAAATQRQEVLDAVSSAAGVNLGSSPLVTLGTIKTNRATWDLPVQYLTQSRELGDWVALRDALANDRISTARGEEPDPQAHQLLLGVQAQPEVASAASNLQSNLALVSSAWNAAVYR